MENIYNYYPELDDENNEEIFYVPEGVIELAENAFAGMSSLKQIFLPNTLEIINSGAFADCENLEEIVMPNSVTKVGVSLFVNCENLKKVVFSDNIKELKYGVFDSYRYAEELKLPENLEEMDDSLTGFAYLKNIKIPKKLKSLNKNFLSGCINLESVELNDNITEIPENMFSNCKKLKEIELPKNLVNIKESAFSFCESLTKINLPSTLKKLDKKAFKFCLSLKKIELPNNITELKDEVFTSCISLKNINLKNITEIGEKAFLHCNSLKDINLTNTKWLKNDAFSSCDSLINVKSSKVLYIEESVFKNCRNLETAEFKNLEVCFENAFEGCKSLKNVAISDRVNFRNGCFTDCDLNYLYKSEHENCVRVVNELNDDNLEVSFLYNLNEFRKYVYDFDIGKFINKFSRSNALKVIEKLKKSKAVVPNKIFELLTKNKDRYNNLKYFSEMPNLVDYLKTYDDFEQVAIYELAKYLCCFSDEKIVDKYGKETEILLAKKETKVIEFILKNKIFDGGNQLVDLFSNLPNNYACNSFINYLNKCVANKDVEGIYYLGSFGEDMFIDLSQNFHKIEQGRKSIGEDGKPKILSWKDAIKKYVDKNIYFNITPENKDLADLFAKHGLKQDNFDEAVMLREAAKANNMPQHILNKPLKENIKPVKTELYFNAINNIKKATKATLKKAKINLTTLYNQEFSYEMLDKYDPVNAIIGVYASCCATITSEMYGKSIVEATMTAKDVQNIVVRNNLGEIIAKGALYINQKKGYGVINDFELASKYKKHEIIRGIYDVDADDIEEIRRTKIYEAFRRAVNDFAKEYDIQHQKTPLKQVVVGMGYNRIRCQCQRYQQSSKLYSVPLDYSFDDARDDQYIIYKKGCSQKEILSKELQN